MSPIDEFKPRIDIGDQVSEIVKPRRSGKYYAGLADLSRLSGF
jgi:hypothetical protein